MQTVPGEEIKNRLKFDNPWWDEGEVEERFRAWPRRAYIEGFMDLVKETEVKRAVVLMGPRRVGKTVMIQQVIQALLDKRIGRKRILYVSIDQPIYTGLTLEQILGHFQALFKHDRKAKLFIFFDEIQYHVDWERHLKALVDSYPAIKFVVSGSAAAALKMKSDESGAGRFTDFWLPPLNFAEFLQFLPEEHKVDVSVKSDPEAILNEYFLDYLNFGGFPEAVIQRQVRDEMSRFVANDIVDKVLLRDLPSLYGITDTQELKRLFTMLAYNTGQEINIPGLASKANINVNTLKKYLEYLEAAFLIIKLPRMDQTGKRLKKQSNFKIYLTNPCLRSALFGAINADDPAIGAMAETAVAAHLAQMGYAHRLVFIRSRTGEIEIDFGMLNRAGSLMGLTEVKWSDRGMESPGRLLKGMGEFLSHHPDLLMTTVTTKTYLGEHKISGVPVRFVPTAAECISLSLSIAVSLKTGRHPLTDLQFRESTDESEFMAVVSSLLKSDHGSAWLSRISKYINEKNKNNDNGLVS